MMESQQNGITVTDTSITITDTSILQFYKENPQFNFLSLNYLLIDIVRLMNNTNSTQTQSIVHEKLMGIHHDIDNLKSDITIRLMEHKKEYADEFKSIMSSNKSMNEDKIAQLIDKNTEFILLKTSKYLDDAMTKSHTHLTAPIVSKIEQHEKEMVDIVRQIKESSESQTKISTDITEFLNKYKNNSYTKGEISEQELFAILQATFPSEEIINVSTEPSHCDIMMKRYQPHNPTILFENKCYNTQVATQEVKKFEFDLQKQQKHGIFISQNSTIALKPDFHIDIIHGLIHIYISNVRYNADKIKLAVDVIDHLSQKVSTYYASGTEIHVSAEVMNEIAEQYKLFTANKTIMVDELNKFSKLFHDRINQLELPSVRHLLIENKLFVYIPFKCKYCDYIGKNVNGKNAHESKCKKKPVLCQESSDPPKPTSEQT
jgi:hypothetical protein